MLRAPSICNRHFLRENYKIRVWRLHDKQSGEKKISSIEKEMSKQETLETESRSPTEKEEKAGESEPLNVTFELSPGDPPSNKLTSQSAVFVEEGTKHIVEKQPMSNDKDEQAKICKLYLRQECDHGRSGRNCKYKHPKLCFYNKYKGGCKITECKFWHPEICKKGMDCMLKSCKCLHLKAPKKEIKGSKNERGPQSIRKTAQIERPNQTQKLMPRNEGRNIDVSMLTEVFLSLIQTLLNRGADMR